MFSEAIWKELRYRESQFTKVLAGGKPDYVPSWYFNSDLKQTRPELLIAEKDKEKWLENQLRAVRENVEETLDGVSLYYPIIEMFSLYGTHYIDKLLGGDVSWTGEQFWSKELSCEVSELQPPNLKNSALLKETVELAIWIKEKTDGKFLISMPDVGCPLNVAINLFGEKFLLEIAINPESAKRVLMIIADATRMVYEALIDAVGQKTIRCHNAFYVYTPYDYAGLSICATQMISPDNFSDIVADADDTSVPGVYKGMIQHLCGRSGQHVPEIAKRQRIKGVQLNDAAADQFEMYHKGLREDQVFYIWPTENMPLEKVLSITGGRRLVIIGQNINKKIKPE